MDQRDRSETAERRNSDGDAGAPAGDPIVRWCCWCKQTGIRNVRQTDLVMVVIQNGERKAYLQGAEIVIQDGICENCKLVAWV